MNLHDKVMELMPVVVGGTIGILGKFLANLLDKLIDYKRMKQKVDEERIEKLFTEVFLLDEGIERFREHHLFYGEAFKWSSSEATISTLISLYFYELEPFWASFYEQVNVYRLWIIDAGQAKAKQIKPSLPEPSLPKKYLDQFEDVYGTYRTAQQAFRKAIVEYKRDYKK